MGAIVGAKILRRDCISKWGRVGKGGKEERLQHRVNRAAAERTEIARRGFSPRRKERRKEKNNAENAEETQRKERQEERRGAWRWAYGWEMN
jgi:hypothetical protein